MHVAFEPGGFPRDVGLLLVGHGSREAIGRDEFLAVARRVAALAGDCAVEPCFLEFAAPSIAAGFQALAQRGKRRIVVVPVLLFSAGHAQRDIPAAVAAAAAEHSGIAVEQCRHLGCHEAILALSRQRFDEATAHLQPAIDRTALVMVGRGSHDAEATAEMRRFVELRAADTPWHRVFTSFVTMAEPSYVDALAEAADCGAARIVVQPHLLFGGVLVDRIRETVADFARRYPKPEWVSAAHLGPAELVAQAILARAAETLSNVVAPACNSPNR
jgi:sirohydrochlorin cobaltochelatase